MPDCCKLVGNFPVPSQLADKCIISIDISSSTESQKFENCFTIGPTVGTISMSGYAAETVHVGCAGKASVQIPWIRKYDCDVEGGRVYFIPAGEGRSSIVGDVGGLASIRSGYIINSYDIINASSASGPATIYTDEQQTDGYGLIYSGGPFAIDTGDTIIYPDYFGLGTEDGYHLQSFSLQCTPGAIPVASYSFVFSIQSGGV